MLDVSPKKDLEIAILGSSAFQKKLGGNPFGFTSNPDSKRGLHSFFCALKGGKLAGYAKFEENKKYQDLYLAYLEVHKDFRGQFLSHALLSSLFDYAANTNKSIVLSPYTPMGLQRLHAQIRLLQSLHPKITVVHEQHC